MELHEWFSSKTLALTPQPITCITIVYCQLLLQEGTRSAAILSDLLLLLARKVHITLMHANCLIN